jgi:hypothetical protein
MQSNLSKTGKKKKKEELLNLEIQKDNLDLDPAPVLDTNQEISMTDKSQSFSVKEPPIPKELKGSPDIISMSTLDDYVSVVTVNDDEEDLDPMSNILARQWYWRGIAVLSFLAGVGCMYFSMRLKERTHHQRRFGP